MKHLLLLAIAFVCTPALANVPNVYNPSGSDRIRTADGSTCEQAVATGTVFSAGVYGNDDSYDNHDYGGYGYERNDKGVYAGIQVQLGSKERVDCTRLYEYEMRQRSREDKLAEAEYELRMLQIQEETKRLAKRKTTHFSE